MTTPSAMLTPQDAMAVSVTPTEGRMPAPPQRHPAAPISPYIQEAARRAALPIKVKCLPSGEHFFAAPAIRISAWKGEYEWLATLPPQRAKRAYLDLVNSLSGVSQ